MVPACDGQMDRQTDGRTDFPWLVQRLHCFAMRKRCKNRFCQAHECDQQTQTDHATYEITATGCIVMLAMWPNDAMFLPTIIYHQWRHQDLGSGGGAPWRWDRDAKGIEGERYGEEVSPSPSDYGVWGSLVSSPVGSGVEQKIIFVDIERLKSHMKYIIHETIEEAEDVIQHTGENWSLRNQLGNHITVNQVTMPN